MKNFRISFLTLTLLMTASSMAFGYTLKLNYTGLIDDHLGLCSGQKNCIGIPSGTGSIQMKVQNGVNKACVDLYNDTDRSYLYQVIDPNKDVTLAIQQQGFTVAHLPAHNARLIGVPYGKCVWILKHDAATSRK